MLRASRAEFIQARSRMQATGEALDDFLLVYLQEGPEFAGEYPQRIADERAAQAAYRAEHDRRAALARRLVQWGWRERNSLDSSEQPLHAVRRCKGSSRRRRRTAGGPKGLHPEKREIEHRYVSPALSAG